MKTDKQGKETKPLKVSWKQEKFRPAIPYMYLFVILFMFFCVVFICVRTFAPEPMGLLSAQCPCEGISRCICPRETVEALDVFQIFCLAMSRISAYMCYPLYLILFLSMARNLKAWLQHTVLVEYVPLTSIHSLHVWAGTIVGVAVSWHGIWHIIRWGVQHNLNFLIDTPTGITGLICLVITPLLVWPMRLVYLRKKISFEVRKRGHYLSWVWMGSLMFHAPAQHVFWIAGSAFLVYLIDWFYGVFLNTRVAPSARFVRLESAVMIRVPKSEGIELKGAGGYFYLCVPWVSKVEWHAFSAFKDPFDAGCICFCIAVAGDWTQKLHNEVREPIYRRLWLYGPFPSPFESAVDNDNVISVASGIGITPALSVIKSLADHRRMNLIWIVRDASLLEFMIDYGIRFDEDAHTLIFYTGSRELVFRRALPYNVLLLKGRPDLDDLIVSLIRASQEKNVLDLSKYEMLHEHVDIEAASTLEHHFYSEITRLLLTYSVEELFNAAVRRSHLNSRSVCFEGLRELMNSIFIRKFSDDQLKLLFDQADADGSGAIHFAEFEAFIERLQESAATHNNDFNKRVLQRKETCSISVVPVMDESKSINGLRGDHWRLMYCGGSPQVVDVLKEISSEHRIPLSIESFEW